MSDETVLVIVNIVVCFAVILGAKWLKRFFTDAEQESADTVRNPKHKVEKNFDFIVEEITGTQGDCFVHILHKGVKFVGQLKGTLATADPKELGMLTLKNLHSSLCMVDVVNMKFWYDGREWFDARFVALERGAFPKHEIEEIMS